jgi:tetratricopeptide (TPR) repeat protein
MNYLFAFIGIILLFSYTNPCAAQDKTSSESYKTYIKQADKAFDAKDYDVALKLYEKANQTKPEYNYPSDKIDEIKKILEASADPKVQPSAQPMNTNASYKSLLAKADYANEGRDYATALLYYQKAFQTKPDYNYAPLKINEINSILNAAPDTKILIYENTLLKAESLYEQKNYPQAKSEYEKASLIDTSAQLPKDKLKEISSVYMDPDDMGNFNLAIANGDKALASSDYDHAVLFYEAALEIHPKAQFVNKKLTEAKSQQLAHNAKTEKVAITIASADVLPQPETATKKTNKIENPDADKTGALQIQSEQEKYDAALASAENLFKSADYEAALAGFRSALAIKPSENYPKTKINEIEKLIAGNTSRKEAYDIAIKNGDQSLEEKKYDIALNHYRNALSLIPGEKYPSQKIEEITSLTGKQKEIEKDYGIAIANGDQLLTALKYTEALSAYQHALSIKPNEAYPLVKTAEINTILAKQKSDSENYAQALRTGEKALAAGNYSLALTSFQEAQKIRPSEQYPVEQITEIKTQISAQQNKDNRYNKAIESGDKLFAAKEYNGALIAYAEASELKKNEKYPHDQIVVINKIIAGSQPVDDSYAKAVAEGDKLFGMKDYSDAIASYTKASEIKPAEAYPGQRITEINKIIEETKLARSSEYNKALEVADKLYNTKVFDQAIEAYENAAKMNPGDSYPELQIGKIRKYMSDHAILDLNSKSLTIGKGNEEIFTFTAINPGLRKNNYILLKARSTGNTDPKVYLSYGKDNSKNGGIVLRNLDKSTISDFLISISIQDKWFREDNNWISISVETGEIELTKVQIAAGE